MGHDTDKRHQDKMEFDAIQQELLHEKDMKDARAAERKEHDKATLLARHGGASPAATKGGRSIERDTPHDPNAKSAQPDEEADVGQPAHRGSAGKRC